MSNKVLFIGGPWDGEAKEVSPSKLMIIAPFDDSLTFVRYMRREYVLDGKCVNLFHPEGLSNSEVIKHVNANLRTIHQMIGIR